MNTPAIMPRAILVAVFPFSAEGILYTLSDVVLNDYNMVAVAFPLLASSFHSDFQF